MKKTSAVLKFLHRAQYDGAFAVHYRATLERMSVDKDDLTAHQRKLARVALDRWTKPVTLPPPESPESPESTAPGRKPRSKASRSKVQSSKAPAPKPRRPKAQRAPKAPAAPPPTTGTRPKEKRKASLRHLTSPPSEDRSACGVDVASPRDLRSTLGEVTCERCLRSPRAHTLRRIAGLGEDDIDARGRVLRAATRHYPLVSPMHPSRDPEPRVIFDAAGNVYLAPLEWLGELGDGED